jgi:phosphatidylethanolamine/phosphatidyl-N-methylethanolamine N-methyltransferase
VSHYGPAEKVAGESQRVERVYAVLAGVYDGFFDWALWPGRRRAVEALEILPGHRVLEVGVGTGLSVPLYPPGCDLTGIDISEAMLEKARERIEDLGAYEVSLERMDARELRFPDASFDRVLAPYVVSVVPEPERVMAEIARVCRPGGIVVVVNHFLHHSPPLALLERGLTPVTRWIGFRMDLPGERVIETENLKLVLDRRVNILGFWRLLKLVRTD